MSDSDSAAPQGDAASLHQNPIENPYTEGERDERLCTHVRGDGTLCRAWAMKDGSRLCPGHAGKGVAAGGEAARQAQRQSVRGRQEQAEAAQMSLKQRLAAAVEEKADIIVAALTDVIEHGSDADKLRAVEALLSRVYGKPKETVETVTTPRTVEALRSMTAAERAQLLHQLEAEGRMPVLRAVSSED